MTLKKYVRLIQGFPTKGVLFRDITPLLADADAFDTAIGKMSIPYIYKDIDKVCGIESRGFIFGAAIAHKLGVGFVPIRKEGKLPFTTESVTYDLEYGSATLEIHTDAIEEGDRVLIVDDLLATGGTACAAVELVRMLGGKVVAVVVLVELLEFDSRSKLGGIEVLSLIESGPGERVKW